MDHTRHTFFPTQHAFQSTWSYRRVWSLLCWFCFQCPWLCSLALWYIQGVEPSLGIIWKTAQFLSDSLACFWFLEHPYKNDTETDLSHSCCNESTWHVIQTSETVLHSPWCDHLSWLLHYLFETLYCASWAAGFWDFVECPHVVLLQWWTHR